MSVIRSYSTSDTFSLTQTTADVRTYYSVTATSEKDALEQLANETTPVDLGVPYVDHQGGTLVGRNLVLTRFDVVGKPPAPVGGTGLYHVTATYSVPSLSSVASIPTIENVPVFDIEPSTESVLVDRDYAGLPLVNSANEPFEGVTKFKTTEVAVVRFFTSQYNNWIEARLAYRPFKDKVNANLAYGAMPKCLLFLPPRFQILPTAPNPLNGRPYIMIELRLAEKPEETIGTITYGGWQTPLINFGRRRRSAPNALTYVYADAADGNGKIQDKQVLNAAGTAFTNLTEVRAFDLYGAATFAPPLFPGAQ